MNAGGESTAPVTVGASRAEIPVDTVVDAAWSALRSVYDPELYLDVVALGLVYDVRDEDGTIVVEMTLTTPGCPASESLPDMARAAIVESVGSMVAVDVRIVWDPPWSPALMDAEGAAALGFRVRE
jgi:metal-sulfur cluster biosynthetic enzyme